MVKHKGASNKQTGAYKPPKRKTIIAKHKDKVDVKLKKKSKIQAKNFAEKKLKLKSKREDDNALKHTAKNKLKVKKNKLKAVSEVEGDNESDALEGGEYLGDISEQDIDSEDDLSLDENDLPTPPDITTTEDESEEEGDEKLEEGKEEEAMETNQEDIESKKENEEMRTVFVGNLPKTVKRSKLKKWFSKYGTVECVRLRCAPLADPSIPKKLAVIKKTFHEERSNIHGFVRFTTIEGARSALAANGQLFDDIHHLRVDMAGKSGQQKKFDDKKAIFIGNLPFGAEEDQLRDHFADCGDIISIRIVRDKHTAVGKGFAFINFTSRHSVRLALEKDGLELNGRKLRIQKAIYNQDVEIKPEYRQNKVINKKHEPNASGANVMKFKKKKKKPNQEYDYQGLSSKKDVKRKKPNKKKKKLKKKKEVLKKILNTEGKEKQKLSK